MIQRIDFIEIPITPQMWKKAEKMAKARDVRWASTTIASPRYGLVGAVAELGVRSLLYHYHRGYKADEFEGVGDGGIDLLIAAGSVNVKAHECEPSIYRKLYVKEKSKHVADFYLHCFVWDDTVFVTGIETAEGIIQEEYLGTATNKEGKELYRSYMKQVRYLSYKPVDLLTDRFTENLKPKPKLTLEEMIALKEQREAKAKEPKPVSKFDLFMQGKYKLGSK